ncbi:hypothetical protein ACFZBP_22315 [Streptomyces sp. NPDC008086]|uniref:hypothetical protein n=1 Tax=Streptomyces sp. NPDC008086 TaxID=3364807 RepID=UPI0036E7C040
MHPVRTATITALLSAATLLTLTPDATAASTPLPLPLPASSGESLITEGLTIEGPLVNNVSLPALK